MWCITYHVIPKPGTPEFGKIGGAYVDCWILYAWQDGAEHLARYELGKEWEIIETEGVSWLEAQDIADDDPDKEYFEQALIDGGTYVFNLYSLEAEECDEDFEVANTTISSETKLKSNH